MASFTLFITQAPFDNQSAYSAYRFAAAAIAGGHSIKGIFFYQGGAHNGNSFQAGLSDDLNLYGKWLELDQQHQIPLMVCVTAANRRGVINAEDAEEQNSASYNLSSPFIEVGLGDFVSLSEKSDKVIQF